jgi:hypothetical protein
MGAFKRTLHALGLSLWSACRLAPCHFQNPEGSRFMIPWGPWLTQCDGALLVPHACPCLPCRSTCCFLERGPRPCSPQTADALPVHHVFVRESSLGGPPCCVELALARPLAPRCVQEHLRACTSTTTSYRAGGRRDRGIGLGFLFLSCAGTFV